MFACSPSPLIIKKNSIILMKFLQKTQIIFPHALKKFKISIVDSVKIKI